MSTKHLNAGERATYLIGAAFRRFFDNAETDPRVHALAWAAYVRVLDASLTPDEHHHVMVTTGYTDESWMVTQSDPPAVETATSPRSTEPNGHDDDIPF